MLTFANGRWSEPSDAFFDGMEASFSPDGSRLFFHRDYSVYYVERNGDAWGDPVNVGSAINSGAMGFYPSVTNDGTLFFSRNGNWDEARLMVSELIDGRYSEPVDLGLPVNNGGALHAYVAPDKSYMIFNSPRAGSYTELDLWISYRNTDGSWTEPKNLGETINSGDDANLCPVVSPDGQFLFFTKLDWGENNTATGMVYWVRTDFIDALR
jgi:Tol biopolymer transport system component